MLSTGVENYSSKITSGAELFCIVAMLFPTNDPELFSTFSNATTKTITVETKIINLKFLQEKTKEN